MKRLIVTITVFLLIIISAICSLLFINNKTAELDSYIDSSIEYIDDKEKIAEYITAAIKDYEDSMLIFMMFTEKEHCSELLSELKKAEFNVTQSEEKLTEALNNSKILLEKIRQSQIFNPREIF